MNHIRGDRGRGAPANVSSILITGANRGLGLECARQYADAGWRVIACCRKPDAAAALHGIARRWPGTVSIHTLDVIDHGSIESLAHQLRDEPIDILLNNAGLYGPDEAIFGQTDYREWADILAVNVLAPFKMTECFIENVVRSDRKILANLSSEMGSITLNATRGGHYPYRSSKAALNAVVKSLANDLRGRGVIAVVMHPGWVRTDMGGPKGDLAPEESIRQVKNVLDGLQPADTGKFLLYDGSELPW